MTIVFAVLAALGLIAAVLVLAMRATDRKSSAELASARGDASEVHGGGECNVHVGLPDAGGAD